MKIKECRWRAEVLAIVSQFAKNKDHGYQKTIRKSTPRFQTSGDKTHPKLDIRSTRLKAYLDHIQWNLVNTDTKGTCHFIVSVLTGCLYKRALRTKVTDTCLIDMGTIADILTRKRWS